MKIKKTLKIEKSLFPTDKITHVLWYHIETDRGESYKGIFKGTYKECLNEKRFLLLGKEES